jgi:hypothetical protein
MSMKNRDAAINVRWYSELTHQGFAFSNPLMYVPACALFHWAIHERFPTPLHECNG